MKTDLILHHRMGAWKRRGQSTIGLFAFYFDCGDLRLFALHEYSSDDRYEDHRGDSRVPKKGRRQTKCMVETFAVQAAGVSSANR